VSEIIKKKVRMDRLWSWQKCMGKIVYKSQEEPVSAEV